MRPGFRRQADALLAIMPAGSTWDWTLDMQAEMAATNDSIQSATWTLATGLTAGTAITTATQVTLFITTPTVPNDAPYLCEVIYQTSGGRTTKLRFWLSVVDSLVLP